MTPGVIIMTRHPSGAEIPDAKPFEVVSNDLVVIELKCGHRVQANRSLAESIPPEKYMIVNCTQCESSDDAQCFSTVINFKELDNELRDVYSRLPFVMLRNVVFLPIKQPSP